MTVSIPLQITEQKLGRAEVRRLGPLGKRVVPGCENTSAKMHNVERGYLARRRVFQRSV